MSCQQNSIFSYKTFQDVWFKYVYNTASLKIQYIFKTSNVWSDLVSYLQMLR